MQPWRWAVKGETPYLEEEIGKADKGAPHKFRIWTTKAFSVFELQPQIEWTSPEDLKRSLFSPYPTNSGRQNTAQHKI